MGQKALDACLHGKIFCFAFLFSQLLDSLSLEKRKGNQDLRECFIPRFGATEVIKERNKKKITYFFPSRIPGKGVQRTQYFWAEIKHETC